MPKGYHKNHVRGSRHYRWNERIISSHGYSKIRVGRGHPLADPNGYAYEHLLVWVSAGRRRPGKGELLRFHNGDSLDCRIENLFIASRAEHNRLKNLGVLRDPDTGRVMSKVASRIIQAGATIRTVRAK